MINLPKTYEPKRVERKWYARWEERGYFKGRTDSGKPAYCIVIPPPNVTGSLHMGHALNCTLQDILTRWKRMKGFNTLWLPGTDHAGIATQNVVERQLAEEGKTRSDLGRTAFEKRVWEWKQIAEDNILSQIRKLGCSCDWSRQRFTLDEGLSRAVREVFVRLYEEGLIYKGEYLVNWCPRCRTAISDLEVEFAPTRGHLWHIRYPVKSSDEFLVVATTRPETMLGDTAVAVHPGDGRYHHLRGRTVTLPLMEREIPVVEDSFVDREFGTGAVKVTPGHDPNDFEAGRRHQLPVVKVIDEDGSMTADAGAFAGLDRYQARRRVAAELERLGLLEKVEDHDHNVGRCQRCSTVVEPLVSTQWFVRVKPLARTALQAVEEGSTIFVPGNYSKIYSDWMTNIHDWCISRQLWWGHRIPAWTCQDCGHSTVARTEPESCSRCGGARPVQESDVLDTWFSSGLWPFSTLGWPDRTRDLEVFYPTSTLVTGFDIIFFWVARMMMLGLRFRGDVPFRRVFITGLVRDQHGQKMSKSKGNIIDPLEVIEEYGCDAVRFTLAVSAAPGADIPFSISRMAGYRAFCNKIWNGARFLLLNLDQELSAGEEEIVRLREEGSLRLEDRWILGRLQQINQDTERNLERFFVHSASNDLYHFFWHEFCDWYVELIKGRIRGADAVALQVAVHVLEHSLRLLHPFVPFLTEELWQRLPHSGETIMLAPYPETRPEWIDQDDIDRMTRLQELITALRTARAENNIDPRRPLPAEFSCSSTTRGFLESQSHHLKNLARLSEIEFLDRPGREGLRITGVADTTQFSLRLDEAIDLAAERDRLQRQIGRLQEDRIRLDRKLDNQNFVRKAPAHIVDGARRRRQEVGTQLKRLQDMLHGLPEP